MGPIFFTIASRNYLAQVVTLFDSLQRTHPDCARYLCLVDRAGGDPALDALAAEVVTIEALDLPNFDAFVFRYDILELNTAVKPWMFRWLRNRHADQGIIYLDPDILVTERLTEVERAFADGASIVLTPHLTEPLDDELLPGELSILRSGTYNCGFVAINAHPCTRRMLDWWAAKLEYDCVVDLPSGRFTDQKWIDLVPGMFPDVCILRDPGYNLAYWNLGQRAVSRRKGRWFAGDRPLAFVHFSGIDLERPDRFSRHQNRFSIESIGALRPLYEDYLRQLAANGHARHQNKRHHWAQFDDGELISNAHRRVYRRYHDIRGPKPVAMPRLIDRNMFDLASDRVASNSELPVTRLMYELWCSREDLHHAFDIGESEGREAFMRWFLRTAGHEAGIADRHIRGIRQAYEARHGDGVRSQGTMLTTVSRHIGSRSLALVDWTYRIPAFRRLYESIPEGFKRRLRYLLERLSYAPTPLVAGDASPAITALARSVETSTPANGLNLTGYASGEFGVGEVLRNVAGALETSDVPFVIHDFDVGVASRREDHRMARHFSSARPYPTNLFFINADQMQVAREHLGAKAFDGRHNIGVWAWELERFPVRWDSAFEHVDEIWACSDFVRRSIQTRTRKSVVVLPIPIMIDTRGLPGRVRSGPDAERFLFLASFDFNSHVRRKNPEAVIAAFRLAFPRQRDDVRLLVKTINGHLHAESLRRLRRLAEDDPRIEIRDGFLDRSSMWGLQAACDAYVSLHRAEGFGLGMAECMALGKPVIATAYSGNLDFMNEGNSRLVDFDLVPLREGEYPAWRNQHWAEPRIEQAALHMHELANDPVRARLLGAHARSSIDKSHSCEKLVAFVSARLDGIRLEPASVDDADRTASDDLQDATNACVSHQ